LAALQIELLNADGLVPPIQRTDISNLGTIDRDPVDRISCNHAPEATGRQHDEARWLQTRRKRERSAAGSVRDLCHLMLTIERIHGK
jgi:hypothetical protein